MVVKPAMWVVLFALLAGKMETAPLTSKSVGKYKMYIQLNHNVRLEEDLTIDTKRGIEKFLIPKFKLEVIKDFPKKLDVILDNKTKTCYLSRQQLFNDRPKTLKSLMENQNNYKDKDLRLKDTTTWKVVAEFTQRFLLSKEMAEMCARSSIYWIQKVKGSSSVKQLRERDFARGLCYSYLCWYVRRYRIARYRGRKRFVRIEEEICRRIFHC